MIKGSKLDIQIIKVIPYLFSQTACENCMFLQLI